MATRTEPEFSICWVIGFSPVDGDPLGGCTLAHAHTPGEAQRLLRVLAPAAARKHGGRGETVVFDSQGRRVDVPALLLLCN